MRRISHLIPFTNEYFDEQYIKHQLDVSSVNILNISLNDEPTDEMIDKLYQQIRGEPNEIEDRATLIIQPNKTTNQMIVDENLVNLDKIDEFKSSKSNEKEQISNELYDQSKSISTDLSNVIDQVIETIHVDDELHEAKKTLIIGIEAPTESFSSTNKSENNLSTLDIDKTDESLEMISNNVTDSIDITTCRAYSTDQKSETIIITTEEVSNMASSDYFPMSNIKIDYLLKGMINLRHFLF